MHEPWQRTHDQTQTRMAKFGARLDLPSKAHSKAFAANEIGAEARGNRECATNGDQIPQSRGAGYLRGKTGLAIVSDNTRTIESRNAHDCDIRAQIP